MGLIQKIPENEEKLAQSNEQNKPIEISDENIKDYIEKNFSQNKDFMIYIFETLKKHEENIANEDSNIEDTNTKQNLKKDIFKNWSNLWANAGKNVGKSLDFIKAWGESKKVVLTTNFKDVIEKNLQSYKNKPDFQQEMITSYQQELRLLEEENDYLRNHIQEIKLQDEADFVKQEYNLDIKDPEMKKIYVCSLEQIRKDAGDWDDLPDSIKNRIKSTNLKNMELQKKLGDVENKVGELKGKLKFSECEKENIQKL